MRMVVLKNLPLYFITDNDVRQFCKYDTKISPQILIDTIFKVMELVEEKIQEEISGTKGSILFDGWTCNDIHYVCVLLTYMNKFNVIEDEKQTMIEKKTIS